MQHVNRCANLHLLRNLSSESTKATVSSSVNIEGTPRNIFGTLSQSGKNQLDRRTIERDLIEEKPSGYDKLEFDLEPRKNHYFYKYEITKHARLGTVGIRRALELFHEMKAKSRIEPAMENFSPLIYGCAKAGYTKRAFELYEECLKYDKKPSNSIVTCLLNACAESPFPEYGIQRLDWFMKHIKVESDRSLNEIQYNSAIKAYGKLGRLDEASRLVQEMIDNNMYPSIDTFNMLLIGCASNKQSGCSLALRVYKRIKMYDFKPNLITYRLVLRCIRDCDMGSSQLVAKTFDELPAVSSFSQRLEIQRRRKKNDNKPALAWAPLLADMGKTFADAVHEHPSPETKINDAKKVASTRELSPFVEQPMLPNLLSTDHISLVSRIEAIQFDRIKSADDRLLLFGGLHGYLVTMMQDECKPDNKTFSLLLDCIKPSRENYLEYIKLAQKFGIKRDLIFYDLLIKKVCIQLRSSIGLELALQLVDQMQLDNLRPNITTFEALATGCVTWDQARKLIEDVERCGFIVSEIMLTYFFNVAISKYNFSYLNKLIDQCERVNFKPTKLLVDKLESLRLRVRDQILKQEKSAKLERRFSEGQVMDFDDFDHIVNRWLKGAELREEDHPWAQFQVEHGSKNADFREYARQMQAVEFAKRQALKKGEKLGNLYEASMKLNKTSQ